MITSQIITDAIMKWLPGWYETRDGTQFKGAPVSTIPSILRDAGWRNVSDLNDDYRLKKLGLMVEEARYVGGARPKRFCQVVVASI